MIGQARVFTDTAYAPARCAACAGSGCRLGAPCAACGGAGRALVHQPALQCPRCKGTGEKTAGYAEFPLCIVCRGTGWALVKKD